MKTAPPEKLGEIIDGVRVGGYEAEVDPVQSVFDDPVIDPPVRWTEHEKEQARYSGYNFRGPEGKLLVTWGTHNKPTGWHKCGADCQHSTHKLADQLLAEYPGIVV